MSIGLLALNLFEIATTQPHLSRLRYGMAGSIEVTIKKLKSRIIRYTCSIHVYLKLLRAKNEHCKLLDGSFQKISQGGAK